MTDHIGKWFKVVGLMAGMRPHVAWVTSTEWGEIAAEVAELQAYSAEPVVNKPTNKNFNALRLTPGLLLRNSGTEDQDVCNLLNIRDLGTDAEIFAWRRDNFISGKKSLLTVDDPPPTF